MGSELHLDLETRSTVDLRKTGLFPYWEHEDTDLWGAAYCVDDGPVLRWFPGDPVPSEITAAVDNGWLVFGHNVGFEYAGWVYRLGPKYGWPVPDRKQLRCTAAMAAAMALPRDLGRAAQAMGLDENKDQAGRRLMLQMAKPRRMESGRPVWWDTPDRIERLMAYCEQDVRTERALTKRLRALPDSELAVFQLDLAMNWRGVKIDLPSVKRADRLVKMALDRLDAEMARRTQGRVEKASQTARLLEWLREHGVETDSVDKNSVRSAIELAPDETTRRVLELRQEAAKSSTAKLEAMRLRTCADGRTRETLLYHGASTGRWSGKGIQVQNFPRPRKEMTAADIDTVFDGLPAMADPSWLELWGPPLTVISDCLRGFVTAEAGHELIRADYSNIEGRVLAWLAGEEWKLDAFRDYDAGTGPDLYKLAYARSFGVAVDEVDGAQRQVGKVMELALGYAGGVGAFQSMAALYGIVVSDERADELKVAWRTAHPATTAFWYALDDAAMAAVRNPGRRFEAGKISFVRAGNVLWSRLPSGRLLAYIDARIEDVETPWGQKRPTVTYMAENSITRQWVRHKGYGGLFAENVTQAVARDIMAEALLRLEGRGWNPVMSVHDEAVCEVPAGSVGVEDFVTEMVRLPDWASGLPVSAEAASGKRYGK